MDPSKFGIGRSDVLVALTVALIFFFAILVTIPAVPQDIKVLLGGILGGLMKSFSTMIDFEFGSSRGSKDKDPAPKDVIPPAIG